MLKLIQKWSKIHLKKHQTNDAKKHRKMLLFPSHAERDSFNWMSCCFDFHSKSKSVDLGRFNNTSVLFRRPTRSRRVEQLPFVKSSFFSIFISSFLPFFRTSYRESLSRNRTSSEPTSMPIFASISDDMLVTFWRPKAPKVDPNTSQNKFQNRSHNEAKNNMGNNQKIMKIS